MENRMDDFDETLGSDDSSFVEDSCSEEALFYENKSRDTKPASEVVLKKAEELLRDVLNLGVIGCKITKEPVSSGWSSDRKAPSLEQLGARTRAHK